MEPLETLYATTDDGVQVAYLCVPGKFPPYVFVGSPGAPVARLQLTVPGGYLEQYRRGRAWVFFDWRGSGESDRDRLPVTIDDLVADMDAVIRAAPGPVDAIFAGRGSFVGFLHAARHSSLYRSIHVISGAVRPGGNRHGLNNRPGWDKNYLEHLRSLALLSFEMSQPEALTLAAAWQDAVPLEVFTAYLEVERGIDLTALLPTIPIPTLVAASVPFDYESAALLAALLPNATLSLTSPQTFQAMSSIRREEWDRHLGSRFGEPPSQPLAPQPTTGPAMAHTLKALTEREQEVLALVVRGEKSASIARKMNLSVRTVEHHVASIYGKLGVNSRVEAVNWVRDHERQQ